MNQHSPPPHRDPGDSGTPGALDENIKRKSTWLRLFFMLVFVVIYGIAEFVTAAVIVIQFFWVLLTGTKNEQLRALGQSLATFTYQIFVYLTYNTERRPFPFDAGWPSGPPESEPDLPPVGPAPPSDVPPRPASTQAASATTTAQAGPAPAPDAATPPPSEAPPTAAPAASPSEAPPAPSPPEAPPPATPPAADGTPPSEGAQRPPEPPQT